MEFLVGSDPEMFATDRSGKCIAPIVAENLGLQRIGTLEEKRPDYHPIYWTDNAGRMIIGDGAAFEFTMLPHDNPEDFHQEYLGMKNLLQIMLGEVGLEIYSKPSIPFDLEYFEQFGFENPKRNKKLWMSVQFGCDAQFNAYFDGRPDRMVNARNYPWRHAGGHIHICFPGIDLWEKQILFARMCDIVLGQTALVFSPYPEEEKLRQAFYGKPGNYRTPLHGGVKCLEYRTPSISWLENLETTKKMFQGVEFLKKALEYPMEEIKSFMEKYNKAAFDNINYYREENSQAMLEEIGVY